MPKRDPASERNVLKGSVPGAAADVTGRRRLPEFFRTADSRAEVQSRTSRSLPHRNHYGAGLTRTRSVGFSMMRRPPKSSALVSLAFLLAACASEPPPATTLIRNALVVDGTGETPGTASVRILGDRILEVGQLQVTSGDTVVDATGLALAPGFIDTHSHHDGGLSEHPDALAAVSQGITTIVVGQDGGAPYPLTDFFEGLETRPVAVNVASYAGHNTIRRQVFGDDFQRTASPDEMASMRQLLRQELDAGALGLSSGLEYDPGIYSDTAELIALAEEAAQVGARYATHMRSEDRRLWEAVDEAIEVGRQARIPVQISHIKLAMTSLWGQADRLVQRLEDARAEGVEITADVYPYEYWQSTMTVLFPNRDFDNRESAVFALEELAPPEGFFIARFDPEPSYVGQTLAEIATSRNTDPVTAYMDLIAAANAMRETTGESAESVIATSMDDGDIARLIAWPHSNIGTDGALDGRHPRGFGTFTRILGRYVQEQGLLTLEAAIQKMTALAAGHMGFDDRGLIRAGAFADLVLFDPARVSDRATPEAPQALSVGIDSVWVNGEVVYTDGASTGARSGTVIRRSQ